MKINLREFAVVLLVICVRKRFDLKLSPWRIKSQPRSFSLHFSHQTRRQPSEHNFLSFFPFINKPFFFLSKRGKCLRSFSRALGKILSAVKRLSRFFLVFAISLILCLSASVTREVARVIIFLSLTVSSSGISSFNRELTFSSLYGKVRVLKVVNDANLVKIGKSTTESIFEVFSSSIGSENRIKFQVLNQKKSSWNGSNFRRA